MQGSLQPACWFLQPAPYSSDPATRWMSKPNHSWNASGRSPFGAPVSPRCVLGRSRESWLRECGSSTCLSTCVLCTFSSRLAHPPLRLAFVLMFGCWSLSLLGKFGGFSRSLQTETCSVGWLTTGFPMASGDPGPGSHLAALAPCYSIRVAPSELYCRSARTLRDCYAGRHANTLPRLVLQACSGKAGVPAVSCHPSPARVRHRSPSHQLPHPPSHWT